MVGFYATEEEALAMMEAAKASGMTLADWMRSLIPDPKSSRSASKGKKGAKKKAQ